MHHTRSSSFGGIVGVVCAKSAQVTSLRRDDRGRAGIDEVAKSQLANTNGFEAGHNCLRSPDDSEELNSLLGLNHRQGPNMRICSQFVQRKAEQG